MNMRVHVNLTISPLLDIIFLTFEDEARSASSLGGLGCILGSFGAPVDLGVGGKGG